MVDITDELVVEAKRESTTTGDLLTLLERHRRDTRGVREETVEAFARRLAEERDYAFDAEGFLAEVDDRRTDSEEWVGGDAFYDLGGDRISRYPARWHEELGGSTDATDYVAFLQDVPEFPDAAPGTDRGVPKRELELVMSIVGRMSIADARDAIESQRLEGGLEEDVDQQPNAGVYLAGDLE